MLHTPEDVGAGLPQRDDGAARSRTGSGPGTVERVRKDGTPLHGGRGDHAAHRTPADEPAGFVLVSRDITEQLRLARELERAQAYARSLVESAPDAMVIVDAGGADPARERGDGEALRLRPRAS